MDLGCHTLWTVTVLDSFYIGGNGDSRRWSDQAKQLKNPGLQPRFQSPYFFYSALNSIWWYKGLSHLEQSSKVGEAKVWKSRRQKIEHDLPSVVSFLSQTQTSWGKDLLYKVRLGQLLSVTGTETQLTWAHPQQQPTWEGRDYWAPSLDMPGSTSLQCCQNSLSSPLSSVSLNVSPSCIFLHFKWAPSICWGSCHRAALSF